MRNRVYLFAAAMIAATSAPAFSNEIVIGDTTMIVYDESHVASDAAYGDNYVSGAEIVYVDEETTAQVDYMPVIDDQIVYSVESVEEIYAIDGIEMTQDVVAMTETIDGIVYETVTIPQTY